MDLRYQVAALRKERLLVSGAQSARGSRAGAATRHGDGGVQRPNRRPACRFGGVRTSDRSRNGRRRCDQSSSRRGQDFRGARAAADSRAAQRTICLRKQRDEANLTIGLIVIAPSVLRMAALTQKETRLNRSRLIVKDAILPRSSRMRCTQCVDKKLKMLAC